MRLNGYYLINVIIIKIYLALMASIHETEYCIAGIFRGVKLSWTRTILVIRRKIFVLCIATLTTPPHHACT